MSAAHETVPASYVDAFDERREVAPDVRARVLAAMGLEAGEEAPDDGSVAVVGRGAPMPAAGELVMEDGTSLGSPTAMPVDAPFGYHHLIRDDGIDQLLICGPGRCHLPPGLREWGWTVQLATARSSSSWGIGDLGDLRDLAAWSQRQGAGFLAVSPLGAPNPGPEPEPSPYYPSTRRFGNPLHLDLEELPGGVPGLADLAARGRALNAARVVDRVPVAALKREALDRAWASGSFDRGDFARWRAAQGEPLQRWAVFSALTERFGPGWRSWPRQYHDPASAAVAGVARDEANAVGFHAWVQWCFDLQLADASRPLRRIADMPVGVDPGGFDAWDWQDALASNATVGAPADRFNSAGQDWGLPPFVPHRLRAAHYRPFIETIRAQLRRAGGLRIDHVLGLFRLWWIPGGGDPTHGAYVHYPTDELLEIVALESHRAGALIVGEDLGTVPPGVRGELRRRRLLSTRLALFERAPMSRWPRQSFAAVTTHDLPTIAGLWSGSDIKDQAAAGITPDPAGAALLRRRLRRAAGAPEAASIQEVTLGIHARLAASPAMLVAATLEDALGVDRRPNVPGTTGEQRPNWSIGLPRPLEEVIGDPDVRALAARLRRPPLTR